MEFVIAIFVSRGIPINPANFAIRSAKLAELFGVFQWMVIHKLFDCWRNRGINIKVNDWHDACTMECVLGGVTSFGSFIKSLANG